MNKKIVQEIEKELDNIFYGRISLIIKKGKIDFIESEKSIKLNKEEYNNNEKES